jgi:hypothetical protein
MDLTIKINLDNAAFDDDGTAEVGRILVELVERLPSPFTPTSTPLNLHDVTGNQVGAAWIE